ncbi:hypothetical protein GDO86_006694 [Hymenochirus boettgeri]|uniref:Uncharacterized protein n=1 Tax=Hymenochirus boettgeri TaxID=247094 RepID=A0A8T2J786_9PIPI|nr:hypothetical protein GDO86_006694 [Hymenochirus boettgeri]
MLAPLLLLTLLLSCKIQAFDQIPPGQKYEVVFPRKLYFQHKRDTESKYPESVHYELKVEGEPMVLKLDKTEDLISDDYTETQYQPDGTPVAARTEIQDHCYYQGQVKDDRNSLISISTCKGLSGMIQTRGRRYLIEPLNKTDSEEHAVFPFQAQRENPLTCGVTNTTYTEGNFSDTSFSTSDEEKRDFLKSKKYIQLYMVADNSIFNKYKRSSEDVKERIFEIVNYVNLVYKEVNIFVALTGLEIWNNYDKFTVVSSANDNLVRFSNWRTRDLLPIKSHDNAQFITNMDFDGSTVGLAYVGTMCSDTHSTGVIQDHTDSSIALGATVAHEMGHNLGMNHDELHCTCPSGPCIMEPSLSFITPRQFSTCSHRNYQDFVLQKMPLCMKDLPQKTEIQTPPVCGNKFTEQGEECDCGSVQECTNKCCDAATCKLKPESQCAGGQCCTNCQKAGSMCRAIQHDCDLSEMCDGQSSECPSDRFRVNGFPCRNGDGSRLADSSCFNHNLRGYSNGYCQGANGVSIPCNQRDVKCGVLFCSDGNTYPVVGGYYVIGTCKSTQNPTFLVENGTKCGDNMVCYRSECRHVESTFGTSNCSSKCPKHAVCNHEKQCQCEEGWAPPNCDTHTQTNTIIIVVVISILVVAFFLFLIWRNRSLRRKPRTSQALVTGAVNPTFASSTPQIRVKSPHYPPNPPGQSQKPFSPYAPAAYPYAQPGNPVAFPRPGYAPPAAPTTKPQYPTVPPQASKPRF